MRHQLRAPIADFVGRATEIQQLRTALQAAVSDGGSAIISGVRGMGGIGKTELAYRVAHDLCAAFPQGQIVVELRGASTAPLTPEQAIQGVIHAERPHTDAARAWAELHAGTPDGDRLLLDAALTTIRIARMRYDRRGEIIPHWERSLAAARRLGDRRGEGQVLGNLGNAYYELGDTLRARSYYAQWLTIARALGDRRSEMRALGNLALTYIDLGAAQQAIPYYEQVLAIARELDDQQDEGRALNNLGIAYVELGQAGRAVQALEHALAIARKIGDRRSEGIALTNLGRAYTELGQAQRAIECCEAALTIRRESGVIPLVCGVQVTATNPPGG